MGETQGIWAYNCQAQEMVLLIISVLAMLGDNPMQSEFACHVGLMGKLFCQCCFVQGKGQDVPTSAQQMAHMEMHSASSNSSSEASDDSGKCESLHQLVQRATHFFEVVKIFMRH